MRLIICLLVLFQQTNSKNTKECGAKADVVFVLDSSGSVGSANWHLMLKFVQDVVNIFTIGRNDVQVGVDIFGVSASTKIGLQAYNTKTAITSAVKQISFLSSGNTNTFLAIQHMTKNSFSSSHGHRAGVPKVGIVVTDGKSSSRSQTIAAANDARNKGITLFSIGIGSSIDLKELKEIGNDKKNNLFFQVNDFKALKSIESTLASKACEVFKPLTDCKGGADVVFVVDNSGSIGSTNFNTILKFISDIIDGLEIGEKKFQVGIITFHTPVKREFDLDKYQDKKDLKNAIMSIAYKGGGTNTGKALEYLHSNSFSRASGHRPGVPKIGILITDGYSSNKVYTRNEAKNARLKGIKLFAIGIGNSLDTTELQSVASEPKSQFVFTAASFHLLKSIKTLVMTKACEVADKTCWGKANIVFLLEDSCHVGKENFQKMLDIIDDLVEEIPVGTGHIHVGVNTFTCTARTEFELGKYTDGSKIIKAVQKISYTGGKVNMGEAIEFTRKNSFIDTRNKAKKLMIILTSGSVNGMSKTLGEAQKARNSGIKVMVISVGSNNNINQEVIDGMATEPRNKYVFADDSFDPLRSMRDILAQRKCSA